MEGEGDKKGHQLECVKRGKGEGFTDLFDCL